MSDEPKTLAEKPPIYDEVIAHFKITDQDVIRLGICFAYWPNIYKPNGAPVSDHVMVHEKVHLEQQARMGATEWWKAYISNPDFRLYNEVPAYQAQYGYIKRTRKHEALKWLDKFANDLAGPMYGNVVSYSRAKNLILGSEKVML
jgi:hypothetical protein